MMTRFSVSLRIANLAPPGIFILIDEHNQGVQRRMALKVILFSKF